MRLEPLETVRVGVVGLGRRGTRLLQHILAQPDVIVTAVCDSVAAKADQAGALVVEAGSAPPAVYGDDPVGYERLCDRNDVDLVLTATPWETHTPVMLAAMRADKHGATEIPMSVTVDECWELVETSEATGRVCVPLENVCYFPPELMLFRMAREGLLGEILHAECGYLHDLRAATLGNTFEGRWRLAHSIERNGDLYPTHGIGPVAQIFDINRGNQFDTLVSMASPSRGLNLMAERMYGADSADARRRYALGDVVTTMIRTHNGQTIVVTYDTSTPRPYSRNLLVQGTAGIVSGFPTLQVYLEDRSPDHEWEDGASYLSEFEHPLYTRLKDLAAGWGHDGGDYVMLYRLFETLRGGVAPDIDVYDGAAWSAISELSERSIASGSQPVTIPDFTRGQWPNRPPLPIIA